MLNIEKVSMVRLAGGALETSYRRFAKQVPCERYSTAPKRERPESEKSCNPLFRVQAFETPSKNRVKNNKIIVSIPKEMFTRTTMITSATISLIIRSKCVAVKGREKTSLSVKKKTKTKTKKNRRLYHCEYNFHNNSHNFNRNNQN